MISLHLYRVTMTTRRSVLTCSCLKTVFFRTCETSPAFYLSLQASLESHNFEALRIGFMSRRRRYNIILKHSVNSPNW